MNESYSSKTLNQFTDELSSSMPVPGGGAAAALTGSLAASLCSMAANITLGKKQSPDEIAAIHNLLKELGSISESLMNLADTDSRSFMKLYDYYTHHKENRDNDPQYKEAILGAAAPPVDILRNAQKVSDIITELYKLSSKTMISDVACAAALCSAAAQCAAMNICVNTCLLPDSSEAAEINIECREMLNNCLEKCSAVYSAAIQSLCAE